MRKIDVFTARDWDYPTPDEIARECRGEELAYSAAAWLAKNDSKFHFNFYDEDTGRRVAEMMAEYALKYRGGSDDWDTMTIEAMGDIMEKMEEWNQLMWGDEWENSMDW